MKGDTIMGYHNIHKLTGKTAGQDRPASRPAAAGYEKEEEWYYLYIPFSDEPMWNPSKLERLGPFPTLAEAERAVAEHFA